MSFFIDWLILNKEWLFQGVGVVFLSFILYLARSIFTPVIKFFWPRKFSSNEPGSEYGGVRDTNEEHPLSYPGKINKIIDKLPPLQRDEASKAYIGQEVSWKMKYQRGSSFSENGISKYRLSFIHKNDYVLPTVSCEVEADLYPIFKVVNKDHDFIISGKIKSIDGLTIKLDEVSIKEA